MHTDGTPGTGLTEWSMIGAGATRMGRRSLLVVVLAISACTGQVTRDAPGVVAADATPGAIASPRAPASATAARAPAEQHPDARVYPDAVVRRLWRLARQPRPVEDSALPPRHRDTQRFPVSLVPRDLIVSGGQPADGIPAIDEPRFVAVDGIDWLVGREPVLVVRLDDAVRVYPVQIMIWHEIVNDRVGDVPLAVMYCPLCNSAVAFDRRVDGRTLDFGTSGALHQSAMVAYDRQTETLWTHFDGRAVVGTLVGSRLRRLPIATAAWADVRRAHPDALVLSRDTGASRPYGRNPYRAYDGRDAPTAGYFTGDPDDRIAAMRRVIGINHAGASVAVTTDRAATDGVIGTRLAGRPITIWHLPGTASALDDVTVAGGRDVGATGVFDARVDGRPVTFVRRGRHFVDDRTGSRWNVLGEAVGGPLRGRTLTALPHVDSFWFAWATYRPDTRLLE
jgi:hypothetical protein